MPKAPLQGELAGASPTERLHEGKRENKNMIIKNALIYTPRHTFEEGSLTIREGRIVPFAQPEEGEEIVDAKGAYALPGLVDIHFHGAMGKDFCDGNEEAIQTLADFEAGKGVLAICPATILYCMSEDSLASAFFNPA